MYNRIEWIDIAKGIGMILVIVGHTFALGYSFPLYAFHMPLFFFISGLLFKDKKVSFVYYIKSKTITLIKPWFVILLISFLVCMAIPQWRSELTLNAVLADLYTSNTNVFKNSSLWYLVCFYFMLLIFYFVNKIEMTKVASIVFVVIAVGLLWMRELLDLTTLPFHRLPFKIDSALIALAFFSLAFYFKDIIITFINGKVGFLVIAVVVVISAGLCFFNGWSNINSLDFGKIRLFYYPIALMGIGSVLLVSKALSETKLSLIKSVLSFYGKNSLLIFGFQSLFIRLYLLLFNETQGLSMTIYGNNPIIHQIGSFLLVTFIMCPLVVIIVRGLRKRNINIL